MILWTAAKCMTDEAGPMNDEGNTGRAHTYRMRVDSGTNNGKSLRSFYEVPAGSGAAAGNMAWVIERETMAA